MIAHRTIHYVLSDIPTLSQDDLVCINDFFTVYENLFQEVISHINIRDIIEWEEIASKGNFRNRFIKEYGKPYLDWGIEGDKAKYYRIIITQVRQQALSIKDKFLISEICEKYDYDLTKLKSIRDDLTLQGLYPTNSLVKNICRSQKVPDNQVKLTPILDFTAEDNQISRVLHDDTENIVYFKIKIEKEWVDFHVELPVSSIREYSGNFARPIIQRNKKTQELYLRFTYEPVIHKHEFDPDLIMGCDQGKLKPITSAIVSKNGSYSTELTYSKELVNISHKLDVLEKEKTFLYAKRSRIEALLTNLDEDSLDYFDCLYSLGGIQEQITFIRNKQSRIRENVAWIVARDVINHALHYNVGRINLENLSVFENTGKWNHALVREKICELAELHGIEVMIVDAKNTSHTDPFTDVHVNPKSTRMMRVTVGERDRDYIASLEIARRDGKNVVKKKRKKKVKQSKVRLVPGKSRDKHAPTPKRPKQRSRKGEWKSIVKPARLSNRGGVVNNTDSGYDIAVHNLVIDSDTRTMTRIEDHINENISYSSMLNYTKV
mgnify:FL=1